MFLCHTERLQGWTISFCCPMTSLGLCVFVCCWPQDDRGFTCWHRTAEVHGVRTLLRASLSPHIRHLGKGHFKIFSLLLFFYMDCYPSMITSFNRILIVLLFPGCRVPLVIITRGLLRACVGFSSNVFRVSTFCRHLRRCARRVKIRPFVSWDSLEVRKNTCQSPTPFDPSRAFPSAKRSPPILH